MPLRRVAVLLLLATPLPVFAQDSDSSDDAQGDQKVYTWTDENGETHYTNQLDQVPGRYRRTQKKAKGGDLSVLPASTRGSGSTGDWSDSSSTSSASSVSPASRRRGSTEADPATEYDWRRRFREARRNLDDLQKQLAEDRTKLPFLEQFRTQDAHGFLVENPEAERCRKRISEAESKIAKAEARLRGLKEEAFQAGVPAAWQDG
jgi:hypothetical protein